MKTAYLEEPNIYVSDDYAGLSVDKYQFYFGYEETINDEWAFVAWVNGDEVMRLPKSKLGVTHGDDTIEYLLYGIALFMKKHLR